MQHGMGTHSSAASSGISAGGAGGSGGGDTAGAKRSERRPTVKWETALFGAEQRWAEAAVAVGTRWGSSLCCIAYPARRNSQRYGGDEPAHAVY